MATGTTIDGLNVVSSLTAQDYVPVWDSEASGEPTKKIAGQNMANSVKTLANLQGQLTFDSTPTTGSNNPVTSGGIATAIAQSTATEATGSYKSPNGTLIQWGVLSGKTGDRISFSVPFVGDSPSVMLTPYYNSATTIRCVLSANPTVSDFLFTAYDTSTGAVSTSTTLQARWIAIGRWK